MNQHPLALTRRHVIAITAGGMVSSSLMLSAQAFGQDAAKPKVAAYPGLALGRPHTDFINTQVAPSRVLTEQNSQPGVDGAALSYNAKGDRAVTVLFRYPIGWSLPKATR